MANSASGVMVTFQSAGRKKEQEECTALREYSKKLPHGPVSGAMFKTVLSSNPPYLRDNTAVVALGSQVSLRRKEQ